MGGANGSRECAPDDKAIPIPSPRTRSKPMGFASAQPIPRAGAALMTTSMRLAENGREGNCEDLVVEIVADMHDPVAPVFRAPFHDQRSHQAGCVVARLGEVAHRCAELIDANCAGAGAVEIDLGHVRSPRKCESAF